GAAVGLELARARRPRRRGAPAGRGHARRYREFDEDQKRALRPHGAELFPGEGRRRRARRRRLMRIGICPGSFDPITLGHLDIIRRAAGLFDLLYVAVLDNPSKRPLFTVQERVELLKEATADLSSVRCESFSGLVVDYAAGRNAVAIVRGVRNQSDYEYELQMASMNK